MNKVILIGRLARDCEFRTLPSGKVMNNFTLAVQEDYKGKDGKYGANFIDVIAWEKAAEFVVNYCGDKGLRVAVEGSLKQNKWQDKTTGKQRSKIVVYASKIEPIDWAGSQQRQQQPMQNKGNEDYSMDSNDFVDDDMPF